MRRNGMEEVRLLVRYVAYVNKTHPNRVSARVAPESGPLAVPWVASWAPERKGLVLSKDRGVHDVNKGAPRDVRT